jgi:RNA recognition motif-containing protein
MTEAVATPQDDGRKVFVGNLAFTVDDESLAAYFSAAGEV